MKEQKQLKEFKENLSKIIKFKSISTDSSYKKEIQKTVDALVLLFKINGFKTKLLNGKMTNPYIFAEYKAGSGRKTILVYGHYDEMPSDDPLKWVGEPFSLTERNGRLYGRGVIDNKGQFTIHLTAVSELIKNRKLNYNVKFILEGNEETGNDEIAQVIKRYKKLLKCDFVLVSDGEMLDDKPTIEAGFRGGTNLTLKYTTANGDVHSGLYGGAIPNAAHELSNVIAKFYGKNNKVMIPGFYEGVDKISKEEYENNKVLKFSAGKMSRLTGIKAFKCEKGINFFSQTGLRPMLTVSGMKSGYIGEGYNNIVPSFAEARINFRFVASQDPKNVIKAFGEFVKKNTPNYVKCEIKHSGSYEALKINVRTKTIYDIKMLLEKVYGEKVLYRYVGGSIPVIGTFVEILKKEVISIPFANEDCNMHGVNENFKLDLAEKALKFSKALFSSSI